MLSSEYTEDNILQSLIKIVLMENILRKIIWNIMRLIFIVILKVHFFL